MQPGDAHRDDDVISTEGSQMDPDNPLGLFNTEAEQRLGISKTGFPIEPATKENPDFLKGLLNLIRIIREKFHSVAQQIGHQIGIL